MLLLDCSEDRVVQAIESGELEFAWDIARRRSRRREIRVWKESVTALSQDRARPAITQDSLLASIFPQRTLRSTDLCRLWSCSSGHLSGLIADGSLAAEPRRCRSGVNSAARIHLTSAVEFLRQRRITD